MSKTPHQPWYQRIGPGLITACVVIGPGSVLASSRVGAAEGYSRNWVVVVAMLCMVVYTSLAAKLGAATKQSPGTLVAQRAGRWLSVAIGVSVFLIAGLFQFGNNLGAHAAVREYAAVAGWESVIAAGVLVALNGLSLAFLFAFKDFYKALERLMMAFVGVMLLSFAVNLVLARPDLGALAAGFIPRATGRVDISVLGMIGTTFVVAAAFLQTYLVQQKGWGKEDVRRGLVDARIGAVILLLITLMIVSTSAAVFHDPASDQPVEFSGVGDVGQQLRPLLGDWGQFVFCLGLFSAAYSSFLVNSMAGGFLLSDGLGLGSKPEQRWPKILTALLLLLGMFVALAIVLLDFNVVPAIIIAQAITVIASPLLAGVLLWLTNRPDIMGEDRNAPAMNIAAGLGFLLLLGVAYYTAAHAIPGTFARW